MTPPDTSPPATCPTCSAPLARAGEPCPRCLLRFGLENPSRANEAPEQQSSQSHAHARSRPPPPLPAELAPHFPELEIVELIGQGGMGSVYSARQRKLERTVALKVLHDDLSRDPAFAERFLREAKALALLSHPHIVAVFDFGERGGHFFLLMELVDGTSLRQLIQSRDLEPSHALSIVREVCEALQFAHDEGIVHRDIKPENVLIDKKGRVKIADFGLAKLVGAANPGVTLTAIDQVMGTLHYMAPEQMEHPRDVDHRADIYSLGVVFYEMLTGSLPIGRFELPSHRVHIDVRLDEIVLKTLEREPSRRYQHAVDVRTDVTHVESGPADDSARPQGRVSLGDAAREADATKEQPIVFVGVHPNVDFSRGIRPAVVFACVWIVVAWLFNFGGVTLAAGAALLSGVAYGILSQWIRRTPELAEALRAESRARKLARAFSASLFFAIGFALLLLAHVAAWEHGSSAYEPPRGALYLATHDRAQYSDFKRIAELTPSVGAELAHSSYDRLDSDDLWFKVAPAPYAFAAVIAWLAAVMCLVRTRRTSAAVWRRFVIGIPLGAIAGLLAVHALSAAVDRLGTRQLVHLTQVYTLQQSVTSTPDALRIALAARGYAVHCEWSGALLDEAGQNTFDVGWMAAHSSSVFDRWRISWSGEERLTPHLLFSLEKHQQYAAAFVDFGRAPKGSRAKDEWGREISAVFRELQGGG